MGMDFMVGFLMGVSISFIVARIALVEINCRDQEIKQLKLDRKYYYELFKKEENK